MVLNVVAIVVVAIAVIVVWNKFTFSWHRNISFCSTYIRWEVFDIQSCERLKKSKFS